MRKIDFTQGIMASPLNDNFEELEEAIRQERLNIGGYGVSYGLDATIEKLTMHFKPGHVIDKEGYSYKIPETTLHFAPPKLTEVIEECDVMHDGIIFLKYMPYSETGCTETVLDNILVEMDNTIIEVLSIERNTIRIDKDYAYNKVNVTYKKANERIDSIVIDKGTLRIVEGASSHSPSIRVEDGTFCIACVLVNPYAIKEDEIYYAKLEKVHETEHLRNVYTNSDNELFLNGVKLSNLGFIYFEKPDNPAPNMIWYDKYTHKLYVYRSHEWVAIDNQSSTTIYEYKLYMPEDCPKDLKTFIFNKIDDMNVRYMAGCNELRVLIDQYPLFRDQYEEITYQKALDDPYLSSLLPQYGYSLDENFNAAYENVAIGFRLNEPLKKECYVQAEVAHRVVDANIHSRHQRSASFVQTGFIDLEVNQTEFETHVPYRYDENQLQLMTSDKNLFEHFDYEEIGTEQGELTRKVRLNRAFGYKQRIHYRITTNIYSYDHIAGLIDEIVDHIKEHEADNKN